MTVKTFLSAGAETAAIELPPVPTAATFEPEFVRLPKPGHQCPYTGLSRSAINDLILPTDKNGHRPPVKSFCLRQRGARTGIRLIEWRSLREYIRQHQEAAA